MPVLMADQYEMLTSIRSEIIGTGLSSVMANQAYYADSKYPLTKIDMWRSVIHGAYIKSMAIGAPAHLYARRARGSWPPQPSTSLRRIVAVV